MWRARSRRCKARWQAEKDVITRIAALQAKIEQTKPSAERAQREAALRARVDAPVRRAAEAPEGARDGKRAPRGGPEATARSSRKKVSEEDIARHRLEMDRRSGRERCSRARSRSSSISRTSCTSAS
jgi:hypothetical protein